MTAAASPAGSSPVERPASSTATPSGERPGSWLIVADDGPALEVARRLGSGAHIVERPVDLQRGLASEPIRIVILAAPPAGPTAIELVAAAKRRRPSLGALLVDPPNAVEERLAALAAGLDDAVPSTITATELLGRARLLDRPGSSGRRSEAPDRRLAIADGIELDRRCHVLRVGGRPVHVRPKEYGLQLLLATHPGRVFSRRQLLRRVWGPVTGSDPRTVDVHVRWLRAKIEADPDRPDLLVTVRGVGYRFDPVPAGPVARVDPLTGI